MSGQNWIAGVLVLSVGLFALMSVQDLQAQQRDSVDRFKPDASLGVDQMYQSSNGHVSEMKTARTTVLQLLEKERTKEDVDPTKLNCINDRLGAIKGFLKVSETSLSKLEEARARNDRDGAKHQYALIGIARTKVANLSVEAQSCAGEVLPYAGKGQLVVDIDPDIAEIDPTNIVNRVEILFRLPEATPYQ